MGGVYLSAMKRPWITLASGMLLCAAVLNACKKDEDEDACFYTPTPRIDLNSWPTGLGTGGTWSVQRDSIPLNVYVVADKSSDPQDVKLTSVIVRILATATDSVLYAEDRVPQSFNTSFQTTVSIGNISADLPASLRITTTNGCGYSDAVVRNLLITP